MLESFPEFGLTFIKGQVSNYRSDFYNLQKKIDGKSLPEPQLCYERRFFRYPSGLC